LGDSTALPAPDSAGPPQQSTDVDALISTAVKQIMQRLRPVVVIVDNGPEPVIVREPPVPPPLVPQHIDTPGSPAEITIPTSTAEVIPPPLPTDAQIMSDDPIIYGPVEEEQAALDGEHQLASPPGNGASLPLDPVFRSDPEPFFADPPPGTAPDRETVTETGTDVGEPTLQPPPLPIVQQVSAASDAPAPPAPARRLAGRFAGPWTFKRILRLAGLAVAAYFATVFLAIVLYRFVNPPTTTLIAYQWMTGTKIEQTWVPIENISSNLLRAVVVSEDWGFCDHYGVDIDALEKALELAGEGKVARGASTISMQVIKNLFLSQSKSYLRKAVEIPLTVVAETVWPKSRMLEIYLNIAEWGPGVFGAEAAARHHFNKPASRLTERESALLAAALPNPILRDAGDPGTRTARKASVIQARMRAAGPVANCAMTGRQRSAVSGGAREAKSPSGWQTTVKKRAGADPGL
jgi:monofunctional biosynthetic peptidoglycan transglycosylase